MAVAHTVLIRCDASPALGGGHAMRCLALADAFAEHGAACSFATNPEAAALVPGLARHRHHVIACDAPDEAEALARLHPGGVDLLVVDHYRRDAAFERACRRFARAILAIDDLADRPHDCDWLVDPTLGRTEASYRPLVPATATLLLGPDHALLRPAFAAARAASLARRNDATPARRILLSFGASDPTGTAARLLGPLLAALPGTMFDVVAGGHISDALARAAANAPERVRLIERIDDMASLMAEADLAVGAAGGMSWERCALGLPAAVVITADNQRAIASALEQAGAALLLGEADALDPPTAAGRIAALAADPVRLGAMSTAAAAIADGRGCERVVERVLALMHLREATRNRPFTLVPATAHDEEVTFALQSEPGARAESRDPRPPSRDGHARWFAQTLTSGRRRLFLMRAEGEAVGSLRLDELDGGALEISILIAERHRGRGFGRMALRLIREALPARRLIAAVKATNIASHRAFLSAGFVMAAASGDENGFHRYEAPAGRIDNATSTEAQP